MTAHSAKDKVPEHELQQALAGPLRNWTRSGNMLERSFAFKDFKQALEFVNAVGEQAERMGHHPDIDIRYNKVKLMLTSHDAGGITTRDLTLAGQCDQLAQRHSGGKTG